MVVVGVLLVLVAMVVLVVMVLLLLAVVAMGTAAVPLVVVTVTVQVVVEVLAVVLTMVVRACPARDAVDAGLDGLARMMPAIVILVLAWAISQVMLDLQLGDIVSDRLKAMDFNAKWLPLAVFLSAAGVSFATAAFSLG